MDKLIITHEIGKWYKFTFNGKFVVAQYDSEFGKRLLKALANQTKCPIGHAINLMITQKAMLDITIMDNMVVAYRIIFTGR